MFICNTKLYTVPDLWLVHWNSSLFPTFRSQWWLTISNMPNKRWKYTKLLCAALFGIWVSSFFSGYQSLSFLQMSLYWSEIDCMGFIQSLLEHILALQHNFNSDRVSDYKQNELPFCLDIKSSLPFHPLFSLISFHLQFFPILFFSFFFVSLKVNCYC